MHWQSSRCNSFFRCLIYVFLKESFMRLHLCWRSFAFWTKVRCILPFKLLWQHSDSEQIRSLSHVLIISLRLFPTLCLNLFKRGASSENRSRREFIVKWIIVNCVWFYYYFMTYTKRSSLGKSPVLRLSFFIRLLLKSISRYMYGMLVAFLNASTIMALSPGYIYRTWLATCKASRAFLNKTR